MATEDMAVLKLCLILSVIVALMSSADSKRQYTEKWFTVPLDHFSFARNETFQLRYLVNESYWDKNQGGPIFFYTGNEGQIEAFAEHTGFMWDIAPEFNALIVFAEHRYYGKSMPFGDKSLDPEHIGYLTSSQALADYAGLVNMLQGDAVTPKYPVIAFGGSYGGMLSAYFRMKYPHLVTGSIAASAPIQQFTGMVPCYSFATITTSNYKLGGDNCRSNIKNSWAVLRNKTKTDDGKKFIKDQWNLCKPVTNSSDVDALIDFLSDMYTTMAMVNYPFESDFLVPLPANPVRYVCQFLTDPNLNGDNLLKAIGKVISTYTNFKGKGGCVDYKTISYGNLDAKGWDYQACTEMLMPMCTTGKDDMFEPKDWDEKKFADDCKAKYKVGPSPSLARVEYGGSRLNAASNIVFSNGLLDPWLSGGILSSPNESIITIVIMNAAHHLDLMEANPADPEYVVQARLMHKENIRKWIYDFQSQRKY